LYEELSTTRRVRLHRQVGEALEELDAEANLPQLAYHFAEAAPGGEMDKAIDYGRRAAEKALALFAYEDAVANYERVEQVLELHETPNEELRCDVLMALGDAQWRSGEAEASKQTYRRVAAIARRLADPARLGRIALAYAEFFEVGTVLEDVLEMLDEALAAIGTDDSTLRALLLARRATAV